MKRLIAYIVPMGVGIIIGYALSQFSIPSSRALSGAIIEGMTITEAVSGGTIYVEQFGQVVSDALEDPDRDKWIVKESSTVTILSTLKTPETNNMTQQRN